MDNALTLEAPPTMFDGAGCLALAMLLGAEVILAALLFRKSPMEALFNKDPLSGSANYLALVAFAIMPRWLFRERGSGRQT